MGRSRYVKWEDQWFERGCAQAQHDGDEQRGHGLGQQACNDSCEVDAQSIERGDYGVAARLVDGEARKAHAGEDVGAAGWRGLLEGALEIDTVAIVRSVGVVKRAAGYLYLYQSMRVSPGDAVVEADCADRYNVQATVRFQLRVVGDAAGQLQFLSADEGADGGRVSNRRGQRVPPRAQQQQAGRECSKSDPGAAPA